MSKRGAYEFDIDDAGGGAVRDTNDNLEKLRRLFRDERIIDGEFGPGNFGDFDNGSWHILCHLAGGSGVYRVGGELAWMGITHDQARDRYQATVTRSEGAAVRTIPLGDPGAAEALRGAQLVGYVEGSSVGHIAARGVRDARDAWNGWPRQMFDRSPDDADNGGTVWEQWCVTRDIRPSNAVGDSSLRAYLTLVSRLGGRFVTAVARGRRQHEHPRHLAALVKAGFVSREEALWDITPRPIAAAAERSLLEATPAAMLTGVSQLAWDPGQPRYYMFQRRIDRWSRADEVAADLARFRVG
jgi:hypothetical protein